MPPLREADRRLREVMIEATMELLLAFREPVSAWSHCLWLILALPGTVWLWKRGSGDRGKQLSLMVFGLSLMFCYASSTLYHGARLPADGLALCNLLDYIGIYLLIAGSYTPLAWAMLEGRWRQTTLIGAWTMAVAGITLQIVYRTLPQSVSTGLYLAMGWGSSFCYFEIARRITHRPLRLVLAGGILYTIGAVINVLEWPAFWPGVFGAHELFHLFVMAGSLCHFLFMLQIVAPSAFPLPRAETPRTAPRPVLAPLPVLLFVPISTDGLKPGSDRRDDSGRPSPRHR